MSGLQIYPHGKNTPASFILSCLRAVFKEQVIHGRWLPAEQLRIHIHMKFNIVDDIQFSQAAMMRVVNKRLPLVSMLDPNIFEDTDGIQLKVYRHSFQIKKRSYFFLDHKSRWNHTTANNSIAAQCLELGRRLCFETVDYWCTGSTFIDNRHDN